MCCNQDPVQPNKYFLKQLKEYIYIYIYIYIYEINLVTELLKCNVTVVTTDKASLLKLVNILNTAVTKNNEVKARA